MLMAGRVGTKDLDKAIAFYDSIAALVGASRTLNRDTVVGYRGESGATLLVGIPYEGEASVGNGVQMGFNAPSRAAVDAVHAKALELGGTCEGAPGLRGPEGPMAFYGAYFRDLDGNKLVVARIGPAD